MIDGPEIEILLEEYLSQFSPDIEALVLGCTHYPLIEDAISKVWLRLFSRKLVMIDPGKEAALKMERWLVHHYSSF
jgi:glutamate racemase